MTDSIGLLSKGLRSVFAAAPPVPYVSRAENGRTWGRRGADKVAQQAAMLDNSDLLSIVSRLSTTTAAVNWRLYRSAPSGRTEDREEVVRHQALKVWKRPNDFTTGREFVEAGTQHIDLTGETWWVVLRAGGLSFPTEMWNVRPDRMVPIPDRKTFLAGYMYIGPDGEEVALGLDQVIVQKMPNPLDPYRGLGSVQTLMTRLDAARYSAEWNRRFFVNGAEPGGILQMPENGGILSDTQFEKLSERWSEQHKGVANAHRVAILEGGMTWVDRKYTNRDMQFVELENLGTDKIRGAFGIPKFALGDVDDVNRATADASRAWYAESMTVPRLDRIKDALNFNFLPMFGTTGEGVEFDYDSPVPPDQETENNTLEAKTGAYKTLVDAGVDPDDAARVVGLPTMRNTGPRQPVGAAA